MPIKADDYTDYNNMNPLVEKCKVLTQSDGVTPLLNPDGSVMKKCWMLRTYPNWYSYDQYSFVVKTHRYQH